MVALAAINAGAAVLFGIIYAAAGVRALSQPAFVGALLLCFAGATALWIHVERSPGRRGNPLSRLGRIAGALALVLVALPGLTLMPLFALKDAVPPEAGIDELIRPAMVLLLVSLALVVLMNLAGVVCLLATAVVERLRRRQPR